MVNTYVLLPAGVDKKIVDQKIAGVVTKHNPEVKTDLSLVPLKNCYLYNIDGGGRFQNIYLFTFTALFILMIATANMPDGSWIPMKNFWKKLSREKKPCIF